jgi:putative phosphoribosyl transferase
MIFDNRESAGQQLAQQLAEFANRGDVLVLGIPRGGVAVAYEIAQTLHLPLDVFLSRKLGVPGHEEFAFGAVAAGDGRYLDQQIVRAVGISPEQIESVTAGVRQTLDRRAALYRDGRPPLEVATRTVILVDDGIATGASIVAAIHALRQMSPTHIVVAVPVAPASTVAWLRTLVDRLVCLHAPRDFYAVGQFYRDFAQVEDDEVIALLHRAGHWRQPSSAPAAGQASIAREVSIDLDDAHLHGTLSIPPGARAIVFFVHGSGSSRHSPRNRYVASVLHSHGIATLLFDLLTPQEEAVDQQTAELRFNIPLLAERLVGATQWVARGPSTRSLTIGYFGASTGAAAALVAAARLPSAVAAVVSRGGRPDLAGASLAQVRAAVLLIVGAKDEMVLSLNRQALQRLQCRHKDLVIVPGATHLFEEPGALEHAAQSAADWFAQYLAPPLQAGDPAPKMAGAR